MADKVRVGLAYVFNVIKNARNCDEVCNTSNEDSPLSKYIVDPLSVKGRNK